MHWDTSVPTSANNPSVLVNVNGPQYSWPMIMANSDGNIYVFFAEANPIVLYDCSALPPYTPPPVLTTRPPSSTTPSPSHTPRGHRLGSLQLGFIIAGAVLAAGIALAAMAWFACFRGRNRYERLD